MGKADTPLHVQTTKNEIAIEIITFFMTHLRKVEQSEVIKGSVIKGSRLNIDIFYLDAALYPISDFCPPHGNLLHRIYGYCEYGDDKGMEEKEKSQEGGDLCVLPIGPAEGATLLFACFAPIWVVIEKSQSSQSSEIIVFYA